MQEYDQEQQSTSSSRGTRIFIGGFVAMMLLGVPAVYLMSNFDDVRYAFESGKVASGIDPYKTLKAGDVYYKESLKLTAATLCFAAQTAGIKVEVEAWT